MQAQVRELMKYYPQIYFACHTRHVRDPRRNLVLSAHQASVLDHLDEIEATDLRTLATHMGVTDSTMSLTVNRLVRQGYVSRNRDPRDARRVNLLLTRAGVRIKSEKSVLDPVRVQAVLEQLSEQERESALGGLALLARASHAAMKIRRTETAAKRRHV